MSNPSTRGFVFERQLPVFGLVALSACLGVGCDGDASEDVDRSSAGEGGARSMVVDAGSRGGAVSSPKEPSPTSEPEAMGGFVNEPTPSTDGDGGSGNGSGSGGSGGSGGGRPSDAPAAGGNPTGEAGASNIPMPTSFIDDAGVEPGDPPDAAGVGGAPVADAGDGGVADIEGFDDFVLSSHSMQQYEGATVTAYFDHNVDEESETRSAVVTSGAFEIRWEQSFDRDTFGAYCFLYVDVGGDETCTNDEDPAWSFFVNNTGSAESPQTAEFDPAGGNPVHMELTCSEYDEGL